MWIYLFSKSIFSKSTKINLLPIHHSTFPLPQIQSQVDDSPRTGCGNWFTGTKYQRQSSVESQLIIWKKQHYLQSQHTLLKQRVARHIKSPFSVSSSWKPYRSGLLEVCRVDHVPNSTTTELSRRDGASWCTADEHYPGVPFSAPQMFAGDPEDSWQT